MHCRMFSSIPGLPPLDAYYTPLSVATKSMSRNCQMFLIASHSPQDLLIIITEKRKSTLSCIRKHPLPEADGSKKPMEQFSELAKIYP